MSAYLLPGSTLRLINVYTGHYTECGGYIHFPFLREAMNVYDSRKLKSLSNNERQLITRRADDQLMLDGDEATPVKVLGGLADTLWEGPATSLFAARGCNRFINRDAFATIVRPALAAMESPLLALSDGQLLYLLIHSGPSLNLMDCYQLDARWLEHKFRQRKPYSSTCVWEKDYITPDALPVATLALATYQIGRPSFQDSRRLVSDDEGFKRITFHACVKWHT
jgi:hypothetical protein